MATISILCADILDWAASYSGEPFHAVLCDPPYGWNFMNRSYDNAIALKPETWAALAEHLLPGAFIMAFGGPRTYHRLACALEDAGLRLFPPVGWLQASGFPKATRIDRQLDDRWAKEEFGGWCECDEKTPECT
jgi:hypothetical protein